MKKKWLTGFRKPGCSRKLWLTAITVLAAFFLISTLNTCIREGKAAGSIENPSIAVIPISNSMCDPEMEYLSAGMHDAIIGELGSINSLLVKSQSATQRYLDSDLTGQQIGNELGANIIVKHSMVCTDQGMRLLVQLIQLFPEEKEIWKETYDLELSNSLTIYRDITKQIVKNVRADMTQQEKTRLNTERPVNSELYKKYLQGVFYMNKLTPEGVKQGFRYLNEAIAIDPSDPLPYLGLALGYSNAGHASDAGEGAAESAKKYALKALELDSTLAEAYTVLATNYLYREWDFVATENALKRAISINPNIASLHYTLAWYLCLKKDQLPAAEEEMKRAMEIDPLDPICPGYLAWLYFWVGKYDNAIEAAQKTLELDPNYPMAHYIMGSAYAEKGMYDKAIESHKKGAAVSPALKCGLGVAYARAGKKKEALEVAAELEKYNSYWFTWGLADIYVALGDKDKAFHWIEAAYNQRHDFVPWFKNYVYYKDLYNDPRFNEIMNRLNLPA
ncbi:MAG: tetratricopeptide repeat protein [Bacteroidales bacterium]|nr:tetratricopeptide repeat protein [Bacteroidales bacterium]